MFINWIEFKPITLSSLSRRRRCRCCVRPLRPSFKEFCAKNNSIVKFSFLLIFRYFSRLTQVKLDWNQMDEYCDVRVSECRRVFHFFLILLIAVSQLSEEMKVKYYKEEEEEEEKEEGKTRWPWIDDNAMRAKFSSIHPFPFAAPIFLCATCGIACEYHYYCVCVCVCVRDCGVWLLPHQTEYGVLSSRWKLKFHQNWIWNESGCTDRRGLTTPPIPLSTPAMTATVAMIWYFQSKKGKKSRTYANRLLLFRFSFIVHTQMQTHAHIHRHTKRASERETVRNTIHENI